MPLALTLFAVHTTMDNKVELGDGYFFNILRCVARNIVEGEYTERDVKLLIHLTEPQGKLKI